MNIFLGFLLVYAGAFVMLGVSVAIIIPIVGWLDRHGYL